MTYTINRISHNAQNQVLSQKLNMKSPYLYNLLFHNTRLHTKVSRFVCARHRIIGIVGERVGGCGCQANLHGTSAFGYELVLHCRTILCKAVHQHFTSRFDSQWADVATGCDLFSVMPHFTRSLTWTVVLHRHEVTLVA